MDQRFVIAIFVAGAELEMRIEKEPQIVFPLGQNDVLVASVAAEDYFVGVERVVGRGRDAVRENGSGAEQRQRDKATHAQRVAAAELLAENECRPQRDSRVQDPED